MTLWFYKLAKSNVGQSVGDNDTTQNQKLCTPVHSQNNGLSPSNISPSFLIFTSAHNISSIPLSLSPSLSQLSADNCTLGSSRPGHVAVLLRCIKTKLFLPATVILITLSCENFHCHELKHSITYLHGTFCPKREHTIFELSHVSEIRKNCKVAKERKHQKMCK